MTDQECVFCKIVRGDIPAQVVWDSPWAVAFLDINPANTGHTLLVLKEHHRLITDVPPALLGAALQELPRLARAVLAATGAEGLNVIQNNGKIAGQVIDHVHFHLIPRFPDDQVSVRWTPGKYADTSEMERVAEEIRKHLSSSTGS